MRKIKILYLVSTLKKSGPLHIVHGIVKGLDTAIFDVKIVALSHENKNSIKSYFEDLDCEILSLDNNRITGLVKNRREIQSIIDFNAIDIVHSHGIRSDVINSRLTGVCRFTTLHNFPEEDYQMQFGKLKGKFMEMQHQKAISKIEHRIACSEYILKQFSSTYGINAHCIQNGIDTDQYHANSPEVITYLRKKLALPAGKYIFLVSGSLIKRKDPKTILKAFKQLDADQNILVFIGSGKLERKLRSKYSGKNILFTGNVNSVSEYLQASDCLISASVSEGLPNSVLEAMSCGSPVILSDIAPHREIVGDKYPFLFMTGDPSDLKQKMMHMLSGKDASSWKGHEALTRSDFNAGKMSLAYQKKYMELCLHSEK